MQKTPFLLRLTYMLVTLLVTNACFGQSTGAAQKFLDEMPSADKVFRDYQGSNAFESALKRCAVLCNLKSLVNQIDGNEFNDRTSGEERIWQSYQSALTKIRTETPDPGGNDHVAWVIFQTSENLDPAVEKEVQQRYFSPEFQAYLATFRKSLDDRISARANEENAEQLKQQQMESMKEKTDKAWNSLYITLGIVALIFTALPLLLLFWLPGESEKPRNAETKKLVDLPDSLRRISVFKKQYEVSIDSGLIYDKEIWTETNVSTTTTAASSHTIGNTVHYTPGSTSTRVSTTLYHRYWYRSPEGKENWTRFADDIFPANKGHIISLIRAGSSTKELLSIVLAYNHTTGRFVKLRGNSQHRFKSRKIWLITAALWILTCIGFAKFGMADGAGGYSALIIAIMFWVALIGLAIGSVYILIIKFAVQGRRNSEFEKKYSMGFKTFLEGSSPKLVKHFDAVPAQ
jgi:hypothetical protein